MSNSKKGGKIMINRTLANWEEIIRNYHYKGESKDFIEGYLHACHTHNLISIKFYYTLTDLLSMLTI